MSVKKLIEKQKIKILNHELRGLKIKDLHPTQNMETDWQERDLNTC